MNVAAFEQARVAAHIHRAEELARKASRPRDRVRALVRALLLDELARYRAEGVFPKNRDFPDRAMPYFIDADGTRCAMAHLLELGGESGLVQRIARERNNALVRELADERALLAWLDAAGISVEEAAAIQPTYCEVPAANICGGDFRPRGADAVGVLEVKVDGATGGKVVAIHGDGLGVAVGDTVSVQGHATGQLVLLPVLRPDSGIVLGSHQGVAIDSNGVLQDSGEHPLTREQVIEALGKPSIAECQRHLSSIDAWYGEREECPSSMDSASPLGCAMQAGNASSAASVAILIALVSAIAARKIRRTQP